MIPIDRTKGGGYLTGVGTDRSHTGTHDAMSLWQCFMGRHARPRCGCGWKIPKLHENDAGRRSRGIVRLSYVFEGVVVLRLRGRFVNAKPPLRSGRQRGSLVTNLQGDEGKGVTVWKSLCAGTRGRFCRFQVFVREEAIRSAGSRPDQVGRRGWREWFRKLSRPAKKR